MQNKFLQITFCTVLMASFGLAQSSDGLSARDLFFTAEGQVAGKKPVTKVAPPPVTPRRRTNTEVPMVSAPKPTGNVEDFGKQSENYFQTVSLHEQEQPALGLRYTFLKKSGDQYLEVRPNSVFHSGDYIRVGVMANQKGYLYMITRLSTGVWETLFPHPDSSNQQNTVVAGRYYMVPGGRGEAFQFDNTPGSERVVIILSKVPVSDIDSLIPSEGAPKKPAAPLQVLQARNHIDDRMIDQLLAGVQSRDLVFTKTDDTTKTPDQPKEEAVYVVNTATADPGARVVVDITLKHQ